MDDDPSQSQQTEEDFKSMFSEVIVHLEACKKQHFDENQPLYIFRKDFQQPYLKQLYFRMIHQENFAELVTAAIKHIYLFMWNQSDPEMKETEGDLKKAYFKVFAATPAPKDELINFIVVVCGFCVHRLLFQLIPSKRHVFDTRFVYEIYHVLIYKFNGLLVSDQYVKIQIDNYLNSKCLEYQISDLERSVKKKPYMKRHYIEQSFLGDRLRFPDITQSKEGEQFQKRLQEGLRPRRRFESSLHLPTQRSHETEHTDTERHRVNSENNRS